MSASDIKPIYIFDIDGTLTDLEHRRHILDETSNDKWSRFYDLCDQDAPIWPVIDVMETLKTVADILLFTGRTEAVRCKTAAWLAHHSSFTYEELQADTGIMTMRPDGNFRADHILKEMWLDQMVLEDRMRVHGVFDDRDSVVAMWRRKGLKCFQCAPGDF